MFLSPFTQNPLIQSAFLKTVDNNLSFVFDFKGPVSVVNQIPFWNSFEPHRELVCEMGDQFGCYGQFGYQSDWFKQQIPPQCQNSHRIWIRQHTQSLGIKTRVLKTTKEELSLDDIQCINHYSNRPIGQAQVSQPKHSNGFLRSRNYVCWQFFFKLFRSSVDCPADVDRNAVPIHKFEHTALDQIPIKRHPLDRSLLRTTITPMVEQCLEWNCPLEWVVYVTDCTKKTNRLLKMLSQKGIPVTMLGRNTLWKQIWGDRIRWFYDYLLTVKDDKIIVWSDADDVFLVPGATIELILDRYHTMAQSGHKLFFCAEKACYPDLHKAMLYPKTDSVFKYLNAGFLIGPALEMRQLLEYMYEGDCSDDQRLWTRAYLDPIVYWYQNGLKISSSRADHQPPSEAKPLIGIDTHNHLSLCLYNVGLDEIQVFDNGTLSVQSTGGHPLVIHASGAPNVKHILDKIVSQFALLHDVPQ